MFTFAGSVKLPPPKLSPHHRMALRPVVAGVDVQAREQLLAALEQFLQGVQEQALAESAGA